MKLNLDNLLDNDDFLNPTQQRAVRRLLDSYRIVRMSNGRLVARIIVHGEDKMVPGDNLTDIRTQYRFILMQLLMNTAHRLQNEYAVNLIKNLINNNIRGEIKTAGRMSIGFSSTYAVPMPYFENLKTSILFQIVEIIFKYKKTPEVYQN